MAAVTASEVHSIRKKMAKRKAGDSNGIVVEMLRCGGEDLWEEIVCLFTDVLDPAASPPESWRTTRLVVLFKKGDRKDPGNYRPISLLSILYKVFTKVIDNRIGQIFERGQSVEQAGFRSGFSCDDHLFAIVQLTEKSYEFQHPL